MKRTLAAGLVVTLVALLGCEEAAKPPENTAARECCSPPAWLRGNWTTEGADTTHADAPFGLMVTEDNVVTIATTAGVDFAALTENEEVTATETRPTSSSYRIRMDDGVDIWNVDFSLSGSVLTYRWTVNGVVRALRYMRRY